MILRSLLILIFTFLFSHQVNAEDVEFKNMFASEDFSEWRVGRKGKGWSLKNGVVHLYERKSGSLMTRKKYLNFELKFDWKISETGNSGIKYRTQKSRGLEYQILDDERHIRGKNPNSSAASLYDLVGPILGKPYNPAGQWNSGKILAYGNHIEHWLNGKKVLEVEIGSEDWIRRFNKSKFSEKKNFALLESPIQLQDHGSDVWFKNVMIRELKTVNE